MLLVEAVSVSTIAGAAFSLDCSSSILVAAIDSITGAGVDVDGDDGEGEVVELAVAEAVFKLSPFVVVVLREGLVDFLIADPFTPPRPPRLALPRLPLRGVGVEWMIVGV